jgi:hypothetical protein
MQCLPRRRDRLLLPVVLELKHSQAW